MTSAADCAALKVLFFGQLRERLNTASLVVEYSQLPQPVNVAGLKQHLAARNESWSAALGAADCLVAVNQHMAGSDTALQSNDEVAFFPPVTGG